MSEGGAAGLAQKLKILGPQFFVPNQKDQIASLS